MTYGLLGLIIIGYFYGILRANILSAGSHFIFDAGLVGLFLSQRWFSVSRAEKARTEGLRIWLIVLLGWPLLMCLLPFQPLPVSIVGLRGNAFFLPVLFLGSRLEKGSLKTFALGLAVLNVVALSFALTEFFMGLNRFFPVSPVTSIIYASRDVAGYTAYRIPAIFSSAHAYAGTMVMTLPFLLGAWIEPGVGGWRRPLMLVGIAAALTGVLMASARSHFVIALILVLAFSFSIRMRLWQKLAWALLLFSLAFMALGNERFQRFKSLGDTESVAERISGSVNRTFWEILLDYPMGNGLGGGGTSIPYFLQSDLRRPVSLESEYARILLEQGVIGLLLWIGFIFWSLTRNKGSSTDLWQKGRRLAWICCGCYFGTGLIGVGLLTSIPQSVLLLLSLGWIATPPCPAPGQEHEIAVRLNSVRIRQYA